MSDHPPDYPLPAEGQPDDREPVPVCPRCGILMRRRRTWIDGVIVSELSCDRHGYETPRWEHPGDDAA